MAEEEHCVFCMKTTNEGTSKLYDKGSTTINRISVSRGDSIVTVSGQLVHTECRRKYCHPSSISSTEGDTKKSGATLRSADRQFTFQTDCLYCGTTINKKQEFFSVTTKEYKNTLLKQCDDRPDD